MSEPVRSGETERDEDATSRSATVVRAPHLFVVLECHQLASGGSRHNLANIDEVRLSRGDERKVRRVVRDGTRVLEIQLADRRLSSRHATFRRTAAGFSYEDLGSTNGSRVDGEPVRGSVTLDDGAFVEAGQTFFRFRAALPTPSDAPLDVAAQHLNGPFEQTLIPAFARELSTLAVVARSGVSVLLLGDTGSGKEVLAQAVHAASGRRGAIVPVNCGAIPDTLIESVLFGHAKGAFSGAVRDEIGLVRAADGGTLFLDEIGNLPLTSQAALLRTLQNGEVLPVGATRPIHVDLRVVAATNAPLATRVAEGSFREDLLARLAGFSLTLPPLRERKEDLGLLVARLLSTARAATTLHADAGRALLAHDHPQNVRELAQRLSLALALSQDGVVRREHLGSFGTSPEPAEDPKGPQDVELEQRLIEELRRAGGNVSVVARSMGKARMQIQRWLKRFGIDAASFRSP